MILFLTSSPTGDLDGRFLVEGFDWRNGFRDAVAARWRPESRCLMIAASPEEYAGNDRMAGFFRHAVEASGLSCSSFDLWDGRTPIQPRGALAAYDVILLGGGHVPTQNAFFKKLGLRELFEDYTGMVIGISAGSMNSADEVYAQPEEAGEAVDPAYQRFITGLGLTKTCILPHLQLVRHELKDDGLRLFEDISIPDSMGRCFYAYPDGSYILEEQGVSTVFGEAWQLKDGVMTQISRYGEERILIE